MLNPPVAETVTEAVARLDSMALAEAAATACWQAQVTDAMAEEAACRVGREGRRLKG